MRWRTISSGREGPGPRSRHGLAYDRNSQSTVLFGGIVWAFGGLLKSDTWELNRGTWKRIRSWRAPPARHRGAMVYLDGPGFSLLFGGQGRFGGMLGDAWSYYNRRWRRLARGPSPRCGHALAHCEREGAAVLFGGIDPSDQPLGDTWLFDGRDWTSVRGHGPEPRRYAALAYDPHFKGCLLHGGAHDDNGKTLYGDTWLFRDRAWHCLGSHFETDSRDDHGMAYHRAAGRLLLLGGTQGTAKTLARCDDGWRTVEVESTVGKYQCSPAIWDESLEAVVQHGGEAHHGGPQLDSTRVLEM